MIDFKKVFNSVSFDFIQKIVNIFAFGATFKNWINILIENKSKGSYKGVSTVNGHPPEQLNISRGYRQGDQIDGYLFVILTLTIQNSKVTHTQHSQG